MYRNRISRKSTNSHPQFFISRSEIAFDERVSYIESVCTTLIESRFGPGSASREAIILSGRRELEPAVFYDLSDEGETLPDYAMSPLGRAYHQNAEAAHRSAEPMGFDGAASRSGNSAGWASNLGRGSP